MYVQGYLAHKKHPPPSGAWQSGRSSPRTWSSRWPCPPSSTLSSPTGCELPSSSFQLYIHIYIYIYIYIYTYIGPLWEGYHESRRCSRDTCPESYITYVTSKRREHCDRGDPVACELGSLRSAHDPCWLYQATPKVIMKLTTQNNIFFEYSSIPGDIWLWAGVPWASSALAVPLPERSHGTNWTRAWCLKQ